MALLKLVQATVDYPIHRRGHQKISKSTAPVGGMIFLNKDREYVRAIDRITIEIPDSKRLALIGGNGSGKSTLLKTLAGILPVSTGTRTFEGRVSTLFSTNIGMDPERTGRENLRRLAALHNIARKDVPDIVADIDDFSELGEFMDLPVKSYSTGMRARLGFAFATGIKADILLIDEVIGVGDKKFYLKARDRLVNLLHGAGIVVMASHSSSIISEFCTSAIVMRRGRIAFRGSVKKALDFYNSDSGTKPAVKPLPAPVSAKEDDA